MLNRHVDSRPGWGTLPEDHGREACRGSDTRHRSSRRSAAAKLETAKARSSRRTGVKLCAEPATTMESEYKRLVSLVNQRVLDVQVRDETYRQFRRPSPPATRPSPWFRDPPERDQGTADLESQGRRRGRSSRPGGRRAMNGGPRSGEYGRIKASYPGVITQRVSPGRLPPTRRRR